MGGDGYHARLGSLVDEADPAEDAADERALAEDAPGSRSTSPVLERRSDALKGFTVGAKVRHKVYKVDALVIQLAAAGDFLDKEKVRIEWEKVRRRSRRRHDRPHGVQGQPRLHRGCAPLVESPRQQVSGVGRGSADRLRLHAQLGGGRARLLHAQGHVRRSGDYRAGGLHPDCHHAPLQQAQSWLSSAARGPLVIGPWCVRVRVETMD